MKIQLKRTRTILKLNEERYSATKIARIINKSDDKFVEEKLHDNYGKRKSCGRLQYRTARYKRDNVELKLDCETNCRKNCSYDKCWECSQIFKRIVNIYERKLQQERWFKQEHKLRRLNSQRNTKQFIWIRNDGELYLPMKRGLI